MPTQMTFEPRHLLQLSLGHKGEEPYVDYIPPARDAITLPRPMIYILVGVVLVVVATYAIVGHLINDLMHDLADWILGPKPEVDIERGTERVEEEQKGSIYDEMPQEEKGMLVMEEERVSLLPGYCHSPTSLPWRATSVFPGKNGVSHQNICPLTPFVTCV